MLNTEDNRELSLQLFVVLVRAYNSVTSRSNRDIQSNGLNTSEFGVLDLLYHKGPQALQKIGEKVLMSSGNITYVVDKLQNKNLLFRRPSKEDRRVIYAELTDEGRELFTQIFPQHHQVIIDALEGLDPSEKVDAIKMLKKLGLAAEGKTDLRS
ncbi:MarR family transcriptional regulator [Paenibacillus sp. ClWae2A]|uniref:MarR family winged helix-turn-helix transcriptional regulator n=1 Tax=Paenibacillus sp. ClWae2A TaxID=3057177 RepID=UPI0028F631E8|nr:MarR family transcriptional regulator [Paenibacillus sp. ClWae2A]MDT9718839.1 MarR family transcriptional regulator [Paenibacillus sp. ClWae2A]